MGSVAARIKGRAMLVLTSDRLETLWSYWHHQRGSPVSLRSLAALRLRMAGA